MQYVSILMVFAISLGVACLLDRKSRPPCCTKTTPLWRHYVDLTAFIPAEIAAVLNMGTRPASH